MGASLRHTEVATTVTSAETGVSISNTYPITFGLINGHPVRREEDASGGI